MPADGAGALPSVPPASADGSAAFSERRRKFRARFGRFRLIAYGLTALIHGVPTLAATLIVSAPVAMLLGAFVLGTTLFLLGSVVTAGRRSALRTVLVDEPVLVHWCTSLLATVLFVSASPFAFLAAALHLTEAAGHGVVVVAAASYAVSFLAALWGFSGRRRWIRVSHVEVPIVGLAPELDGYRVAQITDLHIGNFDSRARGRVWAEHVNALAPDIVAVTGDLVVAGTSYYEDVAAVLGDLVAKDGVFVSLGNHDQWNPDELSRLIAARGPVVLRNASRVIARGDARLVVAGIDDRMTGRDDLDRTLSGRLAGAPTVLLSHYPDFFERAARAGVELVLSGHTHAGQIAVPFMAKRFSLSRLARQHAPGLHRSGKSRLYVNAGLGTTGPPVRFGVAPEIAVFTLRSL